MVSVISILLWVSLEETQKLMSNGLNVPVLFVCQDPRFRNRGTTDGVFRCQRYFRCAPGAGMFVSLDKITIPVAEEFNVRTGKAQEITSHHRVLCQEYVWQMITFGAILTWDQALFFLLLLLLLLWLEREESNTWYIHLTSRQPLSNLHNLVSTRPVMLLANQRLPDGNQILVRIMSLLNLRIRKFLNTSMFRWCLSKKMF